MAERMDGRIGRAAAVLWFELPARSTVRACNNPNRTAQTIETVEENMLNLKGLVHFTIPVTDARKSAEFYKNVLGMKEIMHVVPAGMVFLRCGKDYLILTETKKPLCVYENDDNALHHAFAVESEDFDKSVEYLQSKGVRVIHQDERNEGVFVGRSAYFHDPDRNVLEIIDLKAPTFRPMAAFPKSVLAGSMSAQVRESK